MEKLLITKKHATKECSCSKSMFEGSKSMSIEVLHVNDFHVHNFEWFMALDKTLVKAY